jgi:hypothetical protein
MKKYYIDKRTFVSGKTNYLNTSNFLSLKTYINDLLSDFNNAVNTIPKGTWQTFIGLEKPGILIQSQLGVNELTGHYIKVENDIKVSELSVSIVTGTGNTIAGIYNVDPITGYPTTLVAQTPTQFVNSLALVQSIAFTSSVTLPRGLYVLASNRNQSVTYVGIPSNISYQTPIGVQLIPGGGTPANKNIIVKSSVTYSSTLPDTFPSGAITSAQSAPLISLKIS